MNRLPTPTEADLSDEQREVLEAMRAGPRGANLSLAGPFGIWVRSPSIGNAVQNFGGMARFATNDVPEDAKEVAICTVGVHFEAKFEFAAHRGLALQAGVSEPVLDALHAGQPVSFDNEGQRLAWACASQLLVDKRVDDATYAAALEVFGENGMIELVSVIGYYSLVSMTLNMFQIPVTGTMQDPFPDRP